MSSPLLSASQSTLFIFASLWIAYFVVLFCFFGTSFSSIPPNSRCRFLLVSFQSPTSRFASLLCGVHQVQDALLNSTRYGYKCIGDTSQDGHWVQGLELFNKTIASSSWEKLCCRSHNNVETADERNRKGDHICWRGSLSYLSGFKSGWL